jgi:GTPase SAR1 family protein
MTHCCSGIE